MLLFKLEPGLLKTPSVLFHFCSFIKNTVANSQGHISQYTETEKQGGKEEVFFVNALLQINAVIVFTMINVLIYF